MKWKKFWSQKALTKAQKSKVKNIFVMAKLKENNDGERYIELGKKEHICQPKKKSK